MGIDKANFCLQKTIDKVITLSYNNYSKQRFAPLVVFDTLLLFNFIFTLHLFGLGTLFSVPLSYVGLRLAKLASLLVYIFGFVNWG